MVTDISKEVKAILEVFECATTCIPAIELLSWKDSTSFSFARELFPCPVRGTMVSQIGQGGLTGLVETSGIRWVLPIIRACLFFLKVMNSENF